MHGYLCLVKNMGKNNGKCEPAMRDFLWEVRLLAASQVSFPIGLCLVKALLQMTVSG